ncbi:thioredoxin family protein [Chitinophaga pinensis]|uniref:Thioredoxin family protein n=1 Tax=Chitinophaga pinensis (strain ATCC 43595 / DSM 2588 / LMG 13176 / NBRC 15968 / NCIMB 11800 / UQM 2034) TaxID=485918 RepID=A0A979G9S4_CHIPD|nr:thioredoxin family protein [Chitinophaga pinensis]ACU63391.1 hypothetical protein Cpin_5973 [Chitinophaga pinensis DSM 2588]
MTFEEYYTYFESIINHDPSTLVTPYDKQEYIDYTRLNWSRMNRWLKKGQLSDELLEIVKKICIPQTWIVITEPWCGDAAHSIPFIKMISDTNPLINVLYELRDSEPYRINSYLTKGSKSIPKVIYRSDKEADVMVWGPRPLKCQLMYDQLLANQAPFEEIKTALQHWYNTNKGVDIQQELAIQLSKKL